MSGPPHSGAPSDPGRLPSAHAVGTEEARARSAELFARLSSLEEGTAEYSHTRNALVELNLALVRFALTQFRHSREPTEDLLQVGLIGLIKAINRFDPERGVEFSTFALPTIRGELKRYFRDATWSVRVPRRLQELRLRIAKGRDALAQDLQREPTDAELAAHLGLTPAELDEGRAAGNAYTAGTLESLEDDDAEGTQARHLGCQDHAIEGIENLESLKPLIAALPERERTILALRFGGDLTQAEIGQRLGLSQMHISRILSRTLAGLRNALLSDD